jgi:hypothetical protein
MKFFKHIKNVLAILQLPADQRRLTFYSEGNNYWPHLEGLILEVLKTSDIHICYISSGLDDPGLELAHPNFHAFKTDEGVVRNWLFANIETEVMVMTMPDLHQYQVKRSKFKVHYVYVQHSLVSLHMIYRKGAFDHYDTIFCAGPHHVKEIRAMEEKYSLPKKNLVEHGYSRLDAIIEEAGKRTKVAEKNKKNNHYLLAPSWGEQCAIESGVGAELVDKLISQGHKVTLRPHPQTIKFAKSKVDEIVSKHNNSELFEFESNVAGQESLHNSDIMISDWSGAALDYAFGLNKMVLFLDLPKKINNKFYYELGLKPFEVSIREEIGEVINVSEISTLETCLKKIKINKIHSNTHTFNRLKSNVIGSNKLKEILSKV